MNKKPSVALFVPVLAGLVITCDGDINPPKDCPSIMLACQRHVTLRADVAAELINVAEKMEYAFSEVTATASTSYQNNVDLTTIWKR